MSHDTLNYTRCAVIVHGKSEFALVKYIYTNLHLSVKIIAKDKGRGSIQINGLPEYLMKKQFRTLKAFADEFSVEYDRKTKRLINFKLFIIMDTDDCDEITRSKYISKELFDGHPLKDYIVPLYSDTNLEDVMIKSGIRVLNVGLRPHLTKWQAKYRKWYNNEFIKKNNKKSETPQEIQKRYPEYSVLVEDLVLTNKRMIEYKDLMGKIAFNR